MKLSNMNNTTPRSIVWGLIFIIACLAGCKKDKEAHYQATSSYTVKHKKFSKTLYFSGIIAPIESTIVVSPIEGLIQQAYFKYGDFVKKNQLLLTLSSAKTNETYYNTVLDFLKAKQNYQEKALKLSGSKALWERGVISKNTYTHEKDAYEEAYINQMKARRNLKKILDLTGGDFSSIVSLSLADKEAISQIINKTVQIEIKAPVNGVVLPTVVSSQTDAADTHTVEIYPGNKATENQALFAIGTISGFSLEINIDEMNVNQIKEGLLVTVTGDAFPKDTLKGSIKSVGVNQVKRSSDSMPVFPVQIIVPYLTQAQQSNIHIGMSAKIAVHFPPQHQIMIPINAIKQKGTQTVVMLIDKKTGKSHPITVSTGETTQNEVVINAGLKMGDIIQVFDDD